MAYEELKNSGVTADTPKNILLGAGTIHKGLTLSYQLTTDTAIVAGKTYYTRSGSSPDYTYTAVVSPNVSDIATYYERAWNFASSLMGATSGGNKFTITPEFVEIQADGALVKVKGLTIKTGETAVLEVNFLELTPEIMKEAVLGADSASTTYAGYNEIAPKAQIATGDYISNLAFVGKKMGGDPIIVLFENALCTSGLDVEGKNKENGVAKLTFECYANITDVEKLPWRILYPTPAQG